MFHIAIQLFGHPAGLLPLIDGGFGGRARVCASGRSAFALVHLTNLDQYVMLILEIFLSPCLLQPPIHSRHLTLLGSLWSSDFFREYLPTTTIEVSHDQSPTVLSALSLTNRLSKGSANLSLNSLPISPSAPW